MRKFGLLILLMMIIGGCTRPDMGRLSARNETGENLNVENDLAQNDSSQLEDIRGILTNAESYYTEGVIYYQKNVLDSSQAAFEEALMTLSDLDFDSETFPVEARWLETLLKEIESDYRLTLMTSGMLYSDGSAAAFRELFADIKNFKKLKESNQFHSPSKDSVTYDVPIYMNEKVENSLVYLQTVAHDVFEKYLSRSTKYLPAMEKILEEEGLPHDIVYLPLIESGFNPHAYSYARALGPWQFIYSTGSRYGMKRSWWHDDRRDFEKSTRAAARYLRDLFEEFNSWELALASYNGGEGRVRRMIKSQKTNDFWQLRLKKQTRDYVPLFIAAVMIAKQPEKYGFAPQYDVPLEWETVEVTKCISFANISSKTGIPVSDLEILNPELLRGVTPPDIKNYHLRVPKSYHEKFLALYEEIPSEQNTNWAHHKVRSGETVSSIAAKYGVSMSSLVSTNNLKRPYRIYVGQQLMVPTIGGSASYPSHYSPQVTPDGSGNYVVRRGDTLWEIAKAHGVSLTSLRRANGLSSNRIYPGRKLIIPGYSGDKEPDDIPGTYVVRNGDSLHKIAERFGISIDALKTHNRLKSNTIYPNMKLKIPGRGSSNSLNTSGKSFTSYRVKRGDSLWGIAQAFNVTVHDLVNWNSLNNPSELRWGQVLKIYDR